MFSKQSGNSKSVCFVFRNHEFCSRGAVQGTLSGLARGAGHDESFGQRDSARAWLSRAWNAFPSRRGPNVGRVRDALVLSTNVYHLLVEIDTSDPQNGVLRRSYCTCFVGHGDCIHCAGAVLALMRYRKVHIDELGGEKGLRIQVSDRLEPVSLTALRDKCSAVSAARLLGSTEIVLTVHPDQLDEADFNALKSRVETIRAVRMEQLKKGDRGQPTLGDRLLLLKASDMFFSRVGDFFDVWFKGGRPEGKGGSPGCRLDGSRGSSSGRRRCAKQDVALPCGSGCNDCK